ncbi:hypothetical protein RZS08_58260, partial [Arthrospira platensis SPKY1]|nr:hypothetical protein [Arthrospira platensis SPKY1]
MKSGRQPVPKAGFGVRKVDTRHANLGESHFLAPGLQAQDKLSSIKSGRHQTSIVESVPEAGAADQRLPVSWQGHWSDEAATAEFATSLAGCPALAHAVIA